MPVSIDPISRLRVATWPSRFVLSNGTYQCWVTESGSGHSQFDRWALTVWTPDRIVDLSGLFIYLQDRLDGSYWSVGRRPCGGSPEQTQFSRESGAIHFARRDPGLETQLDICVLGASAGELRRLRLRNTGAAPRELEITTYGEVALQEPAAHAGHPAFSRLFVQTEAEPSSRALLIHRRPRANGEVHPWMAHALLDPAGVSWESDRGRFLGRGGSPRAPRALRSRSPLSGVTGDVLDPCCTLRTPLRVEPGAEVERTFLLAAAENRPRALELVHELQQAGAVEAAFTAAARRETALWASLGLDLRRAAECEVVAGALLYQEPGGACEDSGAAVSVGPMVDAGAAGLLANEGISLRRPLLLVRAEEIGAAEAALTAGRYWRALGLSCDLVITSRDEAVNLTANGVGSQTNRFGITPRALALLQASAGVVMDWVSQ